MSGAEKAADLPSTASAEPQGGGVGGSTKAEAVRAEAEAFLAAYVVEDHILGDLRCFASLSRAVRHRLFDRAILVLILLSSVSLAFEKPGEERSPLLKGVELFFVSVFAAEMLLKITIMGLAGRRDAYLADSWNVLDGKEALAPTPAAPRETAR